jgi:hypothetical protein
MLQFPEDSHMATLSHSEAVAAEAEGENAAMAPRDRVPVLMMVAAVRVMWWSGSCRCFPWDISDPS